MNEDILPQREAGLGRIPLNRASAPHALNVDMCLGMIEALQDWIHDGDLVSALTDHAGVSGSCAGDVWRLAESGRGDAKRPTALVDGCILGVVGSGQPALTVNKLPMTGRMSAVDTPEGTFATLEEDGSTWSQDQLAVVRTKYRQWINAAFKQIGAGAKHSDYAETTEVECRLASRIISRHDCQGGVRAAIIDEGDAPAWSARAISDVLEPDFFAPLPRGEAWTPWIDRGRAEVGSEIE